MKPNFEKIKELLVTHIRIGQDIERLKAELAALPVPAPYYKDKEKPRAVSEREWDEWEVVNAKNVALREKRQALRDEIIKMQFAQARIRNDDKTGMFSLVPSSPDLLLTVDDVEYRIFTRQQNDTTTVEIVEERKEQPL